MKLEGSLAERDLPDLVRDLYEKRWSGTLTLSHRGVGRSMSVSEGRLVFATSSSPDDRLGELLLRRGRITLEQYVEVCEAVAPGKRFGALLVEQGVLSPKDLVRAVVEQTQEIIYGAFQWTEGHYRLNPGGEAGAEAITLSISTPDLILEGIRRIESWARIEHGIGGRGAKYARSEAYGDVLGQMALSFEKRALLTDLNGTREVEAICEASTLPDFEVCRTLWAFRIIGLVRRVDAPPPLAAPLEDEGLDAVLEPPPAPEPVEAPPAAEYALVPEAPVEGRKTILVVGVELFDRIQPLLSRSRLTVTRAGGAKSALALTSRAGFDLVIVEYPLAGMSLDEFFRELRAPGARSAGSQFLALADDARLGEAKGSLPPGPNIALSVGEPQRILEEVACRLLGETPRVATRLMLRLAFQLEGAKRLVMCQTENISLEGMLVRANELYPVGTKLTFETQLPGARSSSHGEAEVVRHASVDVEKVQGMGMRFVDFKGDARERLQEFLAKHQDPH